MEKRGLPALPRLGAESGPLALVYRGPGSCSGCSEAVADLLRRSRWSFDVVYAGPKEAHKVLEESLVSAALYAQPGGDGTLRKAYRRLRNSAAAIKNYVASGGRYLGFCMGGYLAGATPGFGLLPGDTDAFIKSSGASVTTARDTIVQVFWRGKCRYMYFQDGPLFRLDDGATGVTVLATYTNGTIAAMTAPYGRGRVGVVGPHPEATAAWFNGIELHDPDGLDADLGLDLIDTVMQ